MSSPILFDFQTDPQGLREYLAEGGSVDERSGAGGNTLLHMTDDPEVAQVLLDNGLDLETRNSRNNTPLLHVISWGRTDYAAWLLDNGAQANTQNSNGRTPLHLAAGSEDMTKRLIEAGADVNAQDIDGLTPLHQATSVEVADLLIASGADVNARTTSGQTPLHRTRDVEYAQTLIEAGADVNTADEKGWTPLFEAVQWEKDWKSQAPLFAPNLGMALVRELIASGADVFHKDADGKTAAEHDPSPEVAELLESYRRVQLLEKVAGIEREQQDDLATPEQALAARQAKYGRAM